MNIDSTILVGAGGAPPDEDERREHPSPAPGLTCLDVWSRSTWLHAEAEDLTESQIIRSVD